MILEWVSQRQSVYLPIEAPPATSIVDYPNRLAVVLLIRNTGAQRPESEKNLASTLQKRDLPCAVIKEHPTAVLTPAEFLGLIGRMQS